MLQEQICYPIFI